LGRGRLINIKILQLYMSYDEEDSMMMDDSDLNEEEPLELPDEPLEIPDEEEYDPDSRYH